MKSRQIIHLTIAKIPNIDLSFLFWWLSRETCSKCCSWFVFISRRFIIILRGHRKIQRINFLRSMFVFHLFSFGTTHNFDLRTTFIICLCVIFFLLLLDNVIHPLHDQHNNTPHKPQRKHWLFDFLSVFGYLFLLLTTSCVLREKQREDGICV